MRDSTPNVIRREDYRPPPYVIERIDLELDLQEDATRVLARSEVVRTAQGASDAPLVLDGQDMTLVSVAIDGQPLAASAYTLGPESLLIPGVPARFTLEIVGIVNPAANKALEGLYVSGGNFCTQCEAEGFRRITWFLDRPDVMARYKTRIVADKARYPVLLSNGNLVDSGDLAEGRHFALWEDPFPKPCYLFALVAGNLARREGTFVTRSGREVKLHVFVAAEHLPQTEHCLASLQRAMKWDEEVFGREYDLDVYMIVAVRDFNMGAMENKGLNVFNTKYVLASPETATDADFQNIEAVVAHEYFHNWSGNRVTCRDWFQLSLKEGFTVYRDQEFSADVGSRAQKRIQDVQRLLAVQFPEDAGPTAHPVRPDSYVEINNFYTPTVYEKGAEVVRMMHTLLGAERFRKGTDLYFERHDGQAVTCDDFVQAMEDASGVSLAHFRRWYSTAGTPIVTARSEYRAATRELHLTLSQRTPDTPGQAGKVPLLIPVRAGLLGADGKDLPPHCANASRKEGSSVLLELSQASQTFVFEDVPARPTPSLLRGFSAPVRLETDSTDADLLLRMAHDSDPYGRWDAAQTLAHRRIGSVLTQLAQGSEPKLDDAFVAAFGAALASGEDPQLLALSLSLPAEGVIADRMERVDPRLVHEARGFVERGLARPHRAVLQRVYAAMSERGAYRLDPASMGKRSLRNTCLRYLMAVEEPGRGGLAREQLEAATNMTDRIAALGCLVHVDGPDRVRALADFYARYEADALVIDKWFTLQASSSRASTLDEVEALLTHPAFDLKNPNRARSLIDGLAAGNPLRFHDESGRGYAFLRARVQELDGFNPQVAARTLLPLTRFERYEPGRRGLMLEELRKMMRGPSLSRDVYEQVSKALGSAGES
jgi:aminopeptidase N